MAMTLAENGAPGGPGGARDAALHRGEQLTGGASPLHEDARTPG
jgi:hypothetical protein